MRKENKSILQREREVSEVVSIAFNAMQPVSESGGRKQEVLQALKPQFR